MKAARSFITRTQLGELCTLLFQLMLGVRGGEISFKRAVGGIKSLLGSGLAQQSVIDCDAKPFVPDGWRVRRHFKMGPLKWHPNNVGLFLMPDQVTNGFAEGGYLRTRLRKEPVLNACVLDWLLARPELIPDEWKGNSVFFWGTEYIRDGGIVCIRCLRWSRKGWDWGYNPVKSLFLNKDVAVSLAA